MNAAVKLDERDVCCCHFCDTPFVWSWDAEKQRRVPSRIVDDDWSLLEWCGKCDEGRARKLQLSIARGVADARLPIAFGDCDVRDVVLERVHGNEAAVRRVEAWCDHVGGNLTLIGETGAGKTSLVYYAAARAIAAADGASRFLFVSAFDLGVARRNAPLGEEAELVAEALETEALIIDDLGSEPTTHAEVLSYVISSRHEDGRETNVTTWMNSAELGERYGFGVARRVLERVTLVKLRGRK